MVYWFNDSHAKLIIDGEVIVDYNLFGTFARGVEVLANDEKIGESVFSTEVKRIVNEHAEKELRKNVSYSIWSIEGAYGRKYYKWNIDVLIQSWPHHTIRFHFLKPEKDVFVLATVEMNYDDIWISFLDRERRKEGLEETIGFPSFWTNGHYKGKMTESEILSRLIQLDIEDLQDRLDELRIIKEKLDNVE